MVSSDDDEMMLVAELFKSFTKGGETSGTKGLFLFLEKGKEGGSGGEKEEGGADEMRAGEQSI